MRFHVLVLSIALVATSFAFAAATPADCTADQRSGSGDVASERTGGLRAATGNGACEGEHWDGEDTTGTEDSGTGVIYLDPNGRIDRVGVHYNSGPTPAKPDINSNGPTDAVHLRVIGQGSPGWKEGTYNVGDGTLYAGIWIWGVGAAAVTASGHQDLLPCVADGETVCSANPGPGPDGAYLGTAEVGAYVEDGSDQVVNAFGLAPTYDAVYNAAHTARYGSGEHESEGNVLAGAVHFPHVTRGADFGEEDPDCSQATYASGDCSRDNTAATVELLA